MLISNILESFQSIVDFFSAMWNDDERWLCIVGFLIVCIGPCYILFKILSLIFGFINKGASSLSYNKTSQVMKSKKSNVITIKGVYQMNGPKPFTRVIECASSEVGYYSQLMGKKSKQAQWICMNFPGANTDQGFSMSVNIK